MSAFTKETRIASYSCELLDAFRRCRPETSRPYCTSAIYRHVHFHSDGTPTGEPDSFTVESLNTYGSGFLPSLAHAEYWITQDYRDGLEYPIQRHDPRNVTFNPEPIHRLLRLLETEGAEAFRIPHPKRGL